MRDAAHGMQQPAKSDRVLALARELPIVRPRDVEGIGVPREYLLGCTALDNWKGLGEDCIQSVWYDQAIWENP